MTSELKVAKIASPIEKEAVLFDEGIRITGGDYPIVVNTLESLYGKLDKVWVLNITFISK